MATSRWVQFFEGNHNTLSMSRLLCFLSFFPATYVLVQNPSSDMLAWYLSAYAVTYVGGKFSESLSRNKMNNVE